MTAMTTSRKTKRTVSTRTVKGKRAVQKGKQFEDNVAGLYRLLGADVVQNIEVCQKKVDILATFQLPGSTTPHRIIVECKAERTATAQNQRVMQFAGLLDLARKTGEADSAEIVTKVAWGDQAKGFAHARNIALLTFEQKVSQLIDFSLYLEKVTREYEEGVAGKESEPALARYYVAPSAELSASKDSKAIPDLDQYISEWLDATQSRQLAVLGEYGTGKTCFCRKLTHDLVSSYFSNPGRTRIPLLFNLRDFTKTLSIESLITAFLDGVCGVPNPRFQLFRTMNDAGVFLLIFDGFDEMAVRVDADTLEINLREIEKLARPPKARVLLTSRTEYFVSAEEQARVFQPQGQILATRDVEYQPVAIQPWDDDRIELFLQRRVPLVPGVKEDWTFYRDNLRSIPGLSDLAKRPVLLEMIVRTLPQLIASGERINRPNLYHTYLIAELKRQKVVKQRILLMPEATRLAVLQDLAAKFYQQDEPSITFSEALEQIEKSVHPPRSELEAHARDFLNCSFLIRDGDDFRFSHRSIMEYLVASALFAEVVSSRPKAFGKLRLDLVVAGFLAEMKPQADTLFAWIDSTKSARQRRPAFIGGNAITLLCMKNDAIFIDRDLSRANLTGARFFTADLTRTELGGCILKNVDLASAHYEEEKLRKAEVNDAVFGLFLHLKHRRRKGTPEPDISKLIQDMPATLGVAPPQAKLLSWHWTRDETGHSLSYLEILCSNLDVLKEIRENLPLKLPIQSTAVFSSEFREFSEQFPKKLLGREMRFITRARRGRPF